MSILTRVSEAIAGSFARTLATDPAPATAALWTDQAVSQLIELFTKIPETDELLTQAGITRASLKKLETDDEIFQCLRTRREAVVATPWRFEGGKEDPNKFLTDELKPVMGQLVSGAWKAVPYGYSVMEAVYRKRQDSKFPVGLSTVAVKPLEWFDPRPSGELRYFSPDSSMANGEVVDQVYKFFLTRVDATYQVPKGEALLSRLYWPWFFRFNGWRFWAQFLERFGQPLLVGKSAKPDVLVRALIQAHQDAAIAVGKDDSVDAIAPSSTGEAFEKLEQAVVRRFEKVILGQTLTSDSGAKGGGSYALGQVHAEVKEGLRRADIRLVRATAQKVVNALCTLNGITEDIPELVFADDAGLEAARATRDKDLSTIGVKFKKSYFTDRYDLREDDFDIVEPKRVPPALDPNQTPPTPPDPNAPDNGTNVQMDENGNPINPQAGMARSPLEGLIFARRRVADPKRFTPAQQAVEDLADLALSQCGQPLDLAKVRAAVLAASDPRDLEERLALLFSTANQVDFQKTLEQAMFAADVLGYTHAQGKL